MTQLLGKQARKTTLLLFAFLINFTGPIFAKTGVEIVTEAREMIRAQDISVTGKLRTGASNIPFQLSQKNGVSRYVFSDPTEIITVALSESGVKISGVKTTGAPIRGSVLTSDDLALRFLYWTTIEEQGTEKLRSLPCWKIRLDAPDKSSPHAFVKLWVNQQSGAFIRAQAFDWNGVLAKQFDVISTQTIADRYFLKSMKIQLNRPASKDVPTLSYLDIDKPVP